VKTIHLIALGLIAASAGCSVEPLPPLGQVRFFIDTDATLPPAPGALPGDQPALFDRLRIEIFEPGAATPCAECTRELGLDHGTVFEGRASIGIPSRPGKAGYRARVRLYRSAGRDTVEPRATSTLEAVVLSPVVQEEGIVDAHVVLATADLGTPRGTLDAPIAALAGPAEGGLAGTWAAPYDRGCQGAPLAGEVCVRGGAYWMGDVALGSTYGNVSSERLVAVAPYYLDATEVTVAELRASGIKTTGALIPHSAADPHCTYSAKPGDLEDHAVSCVTRHGALKYCATRGARLPTEAEWEFAASARRSAHTVWGDDPPRCADAVYARSDDPAAVAASLECAALGTGDAPVGSGALDHLVLSGGTLDDLAGNLTEWVQDDWAEQTDPCWNAPILINPSCPAKTPPKAYTVRGASWQHGASQLRAALRADVDADGDPVSIVIGFRCARSASGL
jgi:formylglycine-generating enzyme required for sulfatase activity